MCSHAINISVVCLVSHEDDSNCYVWSYARRAIGTHVLRQKHWPGNAMMHPPDPNTFATCVAIR